MITVTAPDGTVTSYRIDRRSGQIKARHKSDVIDLASLQEGVVIHTDIPGKIMNLLGGRGEMIMYDPPGRQVEFLCLIEKFGLRNKDIANLTGSSLSAVDAWTGDPWSQRHTPIPEPKYRLLVMSLDQSPPLPPSGRGRPRKGGAK
ncbi:MAG: hypothetical protein HQL76_06005 [Magnetococcales bacterium]|nr:hypothetical protein [Magnetococcales bacterium]